MGYKEGTDFNSIKAKGQERLELYATGGVIQFRTRTSSGGLGEGFDLLIIDEAQEYTTEQESALKYTVTDSNNPMTIMCGTHQHPFQAERFLRIIVKVCCLDNRSIPAGLNGPLTK
ncbi:hypothetical protein CM318V1_1020001 [Carnobacterium maltaromaticum]|nr:hypothetical protein CM318V1_1020001 [Carnobacterium maltaromaticum]